MDVNIMLARDLMTTPAISCFEDQDVREAAKIMEENQIRRLVVLSRDGKSLVGVISLGDLARNGTANLSGKVLQKVSEPETSEAAKNV
jgi:predicted transcriptional regulator